MRAEKTQDSSAGVNDELTFFPIRSTVLMSLNTCQLILTTPASKSAALFFSDCGKMATDDLSLLVRRFA